MDTYSYDSYYYQHGERKKKKGLGNRLVLNSGQKAAMPEPGLPPTPAPSTDLLAKDNVKSAPESGFSLGPPAIRSAESSASSNASVKSDSSYRPTSASSSRKRPRAEDDVDPQQGIESNSNDYSLPPPPTRSRRIIQMKPAGTPKTKAASADKVDKKKMAAHGRTNSTTTAAGKKTARKTAHSIIERRRRSKMNEEFETLKNMIPACNGQQMHKLAILQAGIDYMRYLEQCVTDLKVANKDSQLPASISQSQAPTPRPQSVENSEAEEDEEEDADEEDDVEMNEVSTITQDTTRSISNSRNMSYDYGSYQASPVVLPQPSRSYHYAASTASSTLPSPSFGPRNDSWSSMDRGRIPYSLSANASPAILPQVAQDAEEASAALLMLNHDRRYSRSDRPTGLSVKDLLSN